MDLKILEDMGLSRAEIKVYLALLNIGLTTTGPLSEKSGVKTSIIYHVLNQLLKKGLVSYTINSNKKYFRAEKPERLKELFEEAKENLNNKEEQLLKVISELSIKKAKDEKNYSITYEGIKGIKSALEFVLSKLEKDDVFYVVDASRISHEKLMGFFNDFHKKRVKKKIKYKVLFGEESLEFAKERKKYSLTEVRILPKDVKIPSVFWIFGDYVVIVVFAEHPTALMIKNNQVSDGFLANFKLLWKISKPYRD